MPIEHNEFNPFPEVKSEREIKAYEPTPTTAPKRTIKEQLNIIFNSPEFYGHPSFYELLANMAELHSRKNHDYAGSEHPLRNFYKSKEMGVTPFTGVMVRLSDKWSRLESFMKQGILEVKGESVEDTLMDNAVYSLLAILLLREEKKDGK